MESASVARRPPLPARALARAPAPTIAKLALVGLVLAAFAGFFAYPTYPNYDSYYSLLWGRELLDLEPLSFEAYRAPTEHPLAIPFGAGLSLLGKGADRVIVLVSLLSLVAMVAGVYRLARMAFTPLIGLLAAVILLTRFDFPFLAVRAYIDVPYIAIVLWAVVLEYERLRGLPAGRFWAEGPGVERRAVVVFALLAAAGMMRPEAWLMAGLYFLWMSWGVRRDWRSILIYALLTAVGPVVWAIVDALVTGDPLFSLHSTSDLAGELGRQRSLSDVPVALPQFFEQLIKLPILAAGVAGAALGLWFWPTRIVMPGILLATGVGTFAVVGVAGLSLINRYLIVAAVSLCIFAALAFGGFTMLRPGSRPRRLWAMGSGATVLLGIVFTALHPPSLTAFNEELTFRSASHRSLERLLESRPVSAALHRGCRLISAPSHKIIPEIRWVLDLPASRVIARSDRTERRRARAGVAIYVQGRRAMQRQGFASNTDPLTQVPPPGWTRIATDTYYSAYANCPRS